MSIKVYPLKPHFYIEKLWVLVRTASARRFYKRVPIIYVLSSNKRKVKKKKKSFFLQSKVSASCMDKFS